MHYVCNAAFSSTQNENTAYGQHFVKGHQSTPKYFSAMIPA